VTASAVTEKKEAQEQTKEAQEQTRIAEIGTDLGRATKFLIAVLAGAAGAAVTLFQVHDRLWPPVKVYGGEVLSSELVQVGTSFQQYVSDHRYLFPDWKGVIDKNWSIDTTRGAVVAVVFKMQGLRERHFNVRYTVYRTPFRPMVGPVVALGTGTSHVQDGDEGGWEQWAQLPTNQDATKAGVPLKGRYFVRFDLFDDHGLLIGPGKTTRTFGWNGETGST
jgi:hypothetical protein